MSTIAKLTSLANAAFACVLMGPTVLLNPIGLYEAVDTDSLPADAVMGMAHMSFLFGGLIVALSLTVICLVYTHQSPRLGMALVLIQWAAICASWVLYPFPTADGVALTAYEIPFSGAWPFIYAFVPLSIVGYLTSPHDLADAKKKTTKRKTR